MVKRRDIRIHAVGDGEILDEPMDRLAWLAAYRHDASQCEFLCQAHLEYLERNTDIEFDMVHLSLSYAIATCYARPFHWSNDGAARYRLDPKFILEGEYAYGEPLLDRTHVALMEMRDRAVAHSDADKRSASFQPGHTNDGLPRPDVGVMQMSDAPFAPEGFDNSTVVEYRLHPEMLPLVGAMAKFLGNTLDVEIQKVRGLLPGGPGSRFHARQTEYRSVTAVLDADRGHPWLIMPPPLEEGERLLG